MDLLLPKHIPQRTGFPSIVRATCIATARVQETEAAKEPAGCSANGLRGEGCHFVIQVRLPESPAPDALLLDLFEGLPERGFMVHAAHDEVRVRLLRRMKSGNGFGNSVTGLNHLLPGRTVSADKDINIADLVEHGTPPKKGKHSLPPAGFEPATQVFRVPRSAIELRGL